MVGFAPLSPRPSCFSGPFVALTTVCFLLGSCTHFVWIYVITGISPRPVSMGWWLCSQSFTFIITEVGQHMQSKVISKTEKRNISKSVKLLPGVSTWCRDIRFSSFLKIIFEITWLMAVRLQDLVPVSYSCPVSNKWRNGCFLSRTYKSIHF